MLEDLIVDLGVYRQSGASDPLHQGDFKLPCLDQVREELRALPQLFERDLLLKALVAYLFLVNVVQEVNDQDLYAMYRGVYISALLFTEVDESCVKGWVDTWRMWHLTGILCCLID